MLKYLYNIINMRSINEQKIISFSLRLLFSSYDKNDIIGNTIDKIQNVR